MKFKLKKILSYTFYNHSCSEKQIQIIINLISLNFIDFDVNQIKDTIELNTLATNKSFIVQEMQLINEIFSSTIAFWNIINVFIRSRKKCLLIYYIVLGMTVPT